MGSEGKDPRLASLGLRKGSRLRLIYDFGDWWVFDFKVVERREGAIPRLTEVIDSIGEVQQYPVFDECIDGYFYDYKSESDYQALNPAQRKLADALYDIDRLTLEGEELQAAEHIRIKEIQEYLPTAEQIRKQIEIAEEEYNLKLREKRGE